ncbi:MAG TPA: hypothetical protein PK093_18345 [Phycisphaerae bacterium]|nr:hypothetical protein [Phycisphaerae bacterium]
MAESIVVILIVAVFVGQLVGKFASGGNTPAPDIDSLRRERDQQSALEAMAQSETDKATWRECPRANCDRMNRPTAHYCASCGCDLSGRNERIAS